MVSVEHYGAYKGVMSFNTTMSSVNNGEILHCLLGRAAPAQSKMAGLGPTQFFNVSTKTGYFNTSRVAESFT